MRQPNFPRTLAEFQARFRDERAWCDTVAWGGRSGKVVSAGKHGVVIEDNGAKHKLFWDEVESVKKPGKHGETTAAWKPSEPGLVDPAKARAALEAAGWKVAAKGITTNSYERPDHPGHGIGLSDEGAWAHNRFKNGNPSAGRSATRSLFRRGRPGAVAPARWYRPGSTGS